MTRLTTEAVGGTVNARIGKVYMGLSKAHRKAADYVLANVFRSATMSIDELADAVGISVATANRFARALGFDGYPQFRAELVSGFESMLEPVEKLRSEVLRPSTSTEIISASLSEDIDNISATRRGLVPEQCEQAVKMILQAERIFIMGYGASSYLAGLMMHGLEPFCRNIKCNIGSGGSTDSARQLFKYNSKDLFIGISFPRYVEDIVTFMQRLGNRGVPMLAITDSARSPLASLANVTLFAQTHRQYSPSSDGAALSLIEAICGAVAHHADSPVNTAAEMIEFMLPWMYKDHPVHNRKSLTLPQFEGPPDPLILTKVS
jgi:DNA-binding MurR/RpiR family transcriptional regulator